MVWARLCVFAIFAPLRETKTMTATYIQDNLKLKISTPLGDNKLLLRAFRGEERISGLFEFRLEMVSEENAIDFSSIVGKPVTVTLTLSSDTEHYLHGIVGKRSLLALGEDGVYLDAIRGENGVHRL